MSRDPSGTPPQLQALELASALGVLALGLGLGVLLAAPLRTVAVPLVIVGGVVHGAAMLRRHRLERLAGASPAWWRELLYWICFLLLAGGAAYLAAG
ncbi:MAG: hypothetical protein LOY01_03235 [Brachybacterium paraconglomeratum]|nr:hypothetical protein [Brachybacterium paraconglomeratum]